MPSPLSPAPVKRRVPDALPPYLSNGVLGIRFPGVPYLNGTTMVSGFAGLNPDDGVEGFARAPFALAADVQVNGVWASAAPEWIRVLEQRYDFASGELHTSWTFRVDGTTATVETLRSAPGPSPHWLPVEVTVRVDRPADMAIAAGIDPTGVPGYADDGRPAPGPGPERGRRRPPSVALGRRHLDGRDGLHDVVRRECRGGADGGVARRARLVLDDVPNPSAHGPTLPTQHAHGRRSGPLHARPDEQAGRLAAVGAKRGFEGSGWRTLPRGESCGGAGSRSMEPTRAGRPSPMPASSTSELDARGLAGEHVALRARLLAQLPLLPRPRDVGHRDVHRAAASAPGADAAHALLDYRFRHLTAAHHNAAMHGWRGAMYPWESCPEHGEEATPGARPYTEDHVSADVALAFAGYIRATGDADYARRVAWPVLRSVAEWVVSRVVDHEAWLRDP